MTEPQPNLFGGDPGVQPDFFSGIEEPILSDRPSEFGLSPLEKELRRPKGALSVIGDILSRGQFAATGLAEHIFSRRLFNDPVSTVARGIRESVQEFFAPDDRRSFKDLIESKAPGFAEANPWATTIGGFVADVVVDPLNLVTFGAAKGAQVTVKTVAKAAGKAGFRKGQKVGLSKAGRQLLGERTSDIANRLGKVRNPAGEKRVSEAHAAITDRLFKLKAHDLDSASNMAWKQLDDAAGSTIKRQTLIDRHGFNLKAEDLRQFTGAVRAEAGDAALVSVGRIVNKALRVGDTSLVDEGGLKFAGKQAGFWTQKHARAVSEALRIPQIKAIIGTSKAGQVVQKGFKRFHKVPVSVQNAEKARDAQLADGKRAVLGIMEVLFRDSTRESREIVGKAAAHLDDLEQEIFMSVGGSSLAGGMVPKAILDEQVGRATTEFLSSTSAQNKALGRTLKDDEKSLMAALKDELNRMGAIEQKSRLIDHMKVNYFPRYLEALQQGPNKIANLYKRTKTGLSTTFTPGEARHFKTFKEAQAAGFDPAMDALDVFLLRANESVVALANAEFDNALGMAVPELASRLKRFGISTNKFGGLAKKNVDRISLQAMKKGKNPDRDLARIVEHVRFISDPGYNDLTSAETNTFLSGYDRALSWFRRSATVVRPAFGVRNFVSNQFQMLLGSGLQGIQHARHFMDPRAYRDAMGLLKAHGDPSIIGRMRDLKTVSGTKISATEQLSMLRQHNIVRNITVEGTSSVAPLNNMKSVRRFRKALDRQRSVKQGLFRGSSNKAVEGMSGLLAGTINYWNIPAYLEDVSRVAMFRNTLASGYDARSAAKFVDDALFDYSNGLSQFETRTLRRLIPFYSFQRFAIPLVATLQGRPLSKVPNAMKIGRGLMETVGAIMGGSEKLTVAERTAVPGFLFEQPAAFAGWTEDMKAKFHTFNNFSPLDVVGFMATNEEGETDWGKTLIHGSLAQLTPLLKIPLETLVGKDFFTGRALKGTTDAGRLDPDKLFGNLVQGALATLGAPTPAIAGGQEFAEQLAGMAPEAAKALMKVLLGYEEGINARTGDPTVYMNPHKLHVLTSFLPAMNDMIKTARQDKSIGERTMQLYMGIPTIKRDLQQDAWYKSKRNLGGVSTRKREVTRAALQQQDRRAKAAVKDLTDYVDWLSTESELLGSGPIRGPGDIETPGGIFQ